MSTLISAITLNPSVDKTLTVDFLVPYGLNRVKSGKIDAGGKGINAARVLGNFGAEVRVCGIKAGENGKLIAQCLDRSEISYDFLEAQGETRVNIKLFDEAAGKITEINEQGFEVSPDIKEQFVKRFESLMQKTDIVILSGSLPRGLTDFFYAELISMAKKHGVKTLLDADGEALKNGVEAVPYALKPNLYELETLVGKKCESIDAIVSAARELIATRIEVIIVSMGSNGAVILDKNEAILAEPWDITVRGTVGAGDSMVAALAYSISKNYSLSDTAKLVVAAGTVTASKSGTELCTFDEVLGSVERVKLSKL